MLLQSIYASIWCFHQPGSMIMSHYIQCTWNWPIWDNSRTNIHQVNCSSSLIYITHSWVLPLNFIHNVPPQYYMSQMQELTLSGAYSFHFLAGSISRRKTIYVLMQVRSSSHWNYLWNISLNFGYKNRPCIDIMSWNHFTNQEREDEYFSVNESKLQQQSVQ